MKGNCTLNIHRHVQTYYSGLPPAAGTRQCVPWCLSAAGERNILWSTSQEGKNDRGELSGPFEASEDQCTFRRSVQGMAEECLIESLANMLMLHDHFRDMMDIFCWRPVAGIHKQWNSDSSHS
jgi:hypothetical protein